MTGKLIQYKNGVEVIAKLKNRRVSVFNRDDGNFFFKFTRLDDTEQSVVIEEKQHKKISTMQIRLSQEATQAVIKCISEIIRYKLTRNETQHQSIREICNKGAKSRKRG
jgi:replicative DNA helicase